MKRTPPEDVARALEMAAAGASDREIGAALDVSARTVIRIRQRHDMPSSWAPVRTPCGSPGRYKAGCRCDTCRAGHRDRLRVKKTERYARHKAGLAVFTHGASAYGNWGCRCQVCTREHAAKMAAQWRKRRSVGGAR
ncbi:MULTISPECIES: helix-turn-helix domain-containing protein [unclassified Streptomyces]|uniref:helix-turn-helix domain-containing protein n=1 Tax=unclassified Streptomyces TaxID=2593676 RepID=UPI0037F8BDEA